MMCSTQHSYYVFTDHETAILYRLQDVILEQSQTLLTAVELTAELDWSAVAIEIISDNIAIAAYLIVLPQLAVSSRVCKRVHFNQTGVCQR